MTDWSNYVMPFDPKTAWVKGQMIYYRNNLREEEQNNQ